MADETKKDDISLSGYWIQFKEALYKSIMNIDQKYFQVSRFDYESILAWRERIYCYELYHQLRLHLPDKNFPYVLHGEIDKKGHGFIGKAFADYYEKYDHEKINPIYPNPDFVVHDPGSCNNLVAMEVKCTVKNNYEIKTGYTKDLSKLQIFICADKIKYDHGIFLIYGPKNQSATIENCSKIKDCLNEKQKDLIKFDKLHIFYHEVPDDNLPANIVQNNALYLYCLNEKNGSWVKVADISLKESNAVNSC
jgi:hypothetical protein